MTTIASNRVTGGGIFLKTLVAAGITHVFVNWGNDHPAFLEELERERLVNGGRNVLEIITAPNEMVAMSAAQGYAQVTGKPAAVIVHVDVGTQGLGAAVHNADKGRVPVIVFSGMSPQSAHGEMKGGKNEWPMWGQDIPDQAAIVRQYMRYTAQFASPKTAAKLTLRGIQFATSQPKGPVYLYARREVLEEEVDLSLLDFTAPSQNPLKWPAVQTGGLSPKAVQAICQALVQARFPLLLTGATDRNPRTIPLIHKLAETFAVATFAACAMQTCISYSHPSFLGASFGGKNALLDEADVILILETDLAWLDSAGNAVRDGAKVFIIDSDPLKSGMGWAHADADMICRADAETALLMLLAAAEADDLPVKIVGREERWKELQKRHDDWIHSLEVLETTYNGDISDKSTVATVYNAFHLIHSAVDSAVRQYTSSQNRDPRGTIWLNEAAGNLPSMFNHIRMTDTDLARGSMVLASGGSGLGWVLGASVGAVLGGREGDSKPELIVAVVGDGTFIFGIPSAAYWMARRYNTPFLTIVLNNGGWKSPKASMMGVYPTGNGSKASPTRLTVGLGPEMVDFGGIAAAAGGAWSGHAELWNMQQALQEAVRVVLEEKRCAVLDCVVESF
ncbi:thiamine diphosphate-binding protein [Cristinia sonorae]|uniref:Thiamine diphosphate-binding protein n=1 Tax=Cristinia sonorae TaxID=1940300 RepID=A0A8K0UEQ4_9AGAR|nr:thiamine diphosphate-binding protein [Cristinia sonorae]